MNRFTLLALSFAILLPLLLPPPQQTTTVATIKSASALPKAIAAMTLVDTAPVSLDEAMTRVMNQIPDRFEGEARCLAQAVYFEARSEPLEGQLAVAQVVLNRVESPLWPDGICAVVFQNEHRRHGCQFSFACDGLSDNPGNMRAWQLSKLVAAVALERLWQDMTQDATHYHADYVDPYWKDHMHPTARYGRHQFYLDDRQALLMASGQAASKSGD